MQSFLVLYLFRTYILLKDRNRRVFLNDEKVESDDVRVHLRELLLSECMCTILPAHEVRRDGGEIC